MNKFYHFKKESSSYDESGNEAHSINFQNLVIKLFSKLYEKSPLAERTANSRTLLISSVRPGEGKTFIARAIAHHALQLSNERVLLVDGNFERPRLHIEYGCPNGFGFSDCLASRDWGKAALHETALPGLTVLPAGGNCKPGLLFRQELLAEFFQHMGGMFRLIIIDGGILKIGGHSLGQQVDGVALVVDSNKTRREVIQGTMENLNLDKDRYFGVILNKKVYHVPRFLYRYL